MKKFKFRLQKVLEYRQTLKEERERELLIKNAALRQEEDVLEQLEQAERENGLPEGITVDSSRLYLTGNYGKKLQENIVQQRLNIMEAQKAVEEATASYIEAAKEERSLSMLKDKKLAEYKDYVLKEDEKFVDELTVQRHALGQTQGGKDNGSDRKE